MVAAPVDPDAVADVPDVVVAGVNPLNWVSVTPELAVSALNWLSNEDSSASTSVGVCTLGIWVAIFWRSAQLLDSFCCSVFNEASLTCRPLSCDWSVVSWFWRLVSFEFCGDTRIAQIKRATTSAPAPIIIGIRYSLMVVLT